MAKRILLLFLFFVLLLSTKLCYSQADSLTTHAQNVHFQPKRLGVVIGGEAALYAGFMVGLNSLWYKDYPKSGFHFFNDNAEWLQMDKMGHITTAYYVGKLGINVMDWTGMKHRNAVLAGGCLGSIFLTTIEIADGYSSEWGFSKGDIVANSIGSVLVIGEELLWEDQRFSIKFSYTPSQYAIYRPTVLGKNFQESLLKDYNAQTYWLSVNIAAFLKKDTRFPKYLNLALGYGADGMLGGMGNPSKNEAGENLPSLERNRQYYFSIDLELSKIKTKSKFLATVFKTIGFIKFPSPTIELNEMNGIKVLPFFF